jgi:hypothetical protein
MALHVCMRSKQEIGDKVKRYVDGATSWMKGGILK